MGRKKKLINNTNIPQYAIERFARCVFDDIRAAYADEEIQKEFAAWQAEQAAKKAELKLHTTKKRAADSSAALFILMKFFLSSWATRFRFGSYLPSICEIGLVIPCEINNKSEPVSHSEDLVRIILLWCRQPESNRYAFYGEGF